MKKVRALSRIPAVIYGRHNPPQNLEVDAREIGDLIHESASENLLIDLAVKDDARAKRLALVQEIQHHPLSGKILHVDFHEVAENEKVTVQVPVETSGEAVGVKTGGGVLEHVLFKLRVRALPKDLPEVQIIIDVSALELGRAIHVGEIPIPEGVEILGNKKIPVVAVAVPRTEAEEDGRNRSRRRDRRRRRDDQGKKEDGEGGEAAKGAAAKPGDKAAAKGAEKAPEKGAAPAAKAAEKPAAKKK